MKNDDYVAIVEKIIPEGPHGPYAVARSDEIGTITFSLTPESWKEDEWPEEGTYIVLSKVRKKRAGWRATLGRYLKPSDEKHPATSNQQRAKEK